MFLKSQFYLFVSLTCSFVFFINLVLGKIEVAYRINTIVHFEGVPEFVLLLVAVIFFIISTLLKEQAQSNSIK